MSEKLTLRLIATLGVGLTLAATQLPQDQSIGFDPVLSEFSLGTAVIIAMVLALIWLHPTPTVALIFTLPPSVWGVVLIVTEPTDPIRWIMATGFGILSLSIWGLSRRSSHQSHAREERSEPPPRPATD